LHQPLVRDIIHQEEQYLPESQSNISFYEEARMQFGKRGIEMRRSLGLSGFSRIRSWCIAALLGIATVCLSAVPASAIIGGQLDGNRHPFVAAIGQPDGAGIYFTGTLISPTVVLTPAHAVRHLEGAGFTTARLTFDPVVSASSTWYFGTIHEDPAYNPTDITNPNDFAVIVLDTPVMGITPASLPSEGLLDQLAHKGPRATFDFVGYGISRYSGGSNGGKPTLDFSSTGTRRLAQESLSSVTSAWLRGQLDGGASACIGDSGSPSVVGGSDVVAAIFILDASLSGGQCQSQPWNIRVDTPSARAFLGQYVTLP
jgi:trypsin